MATDIWNIGCIIFEMFTGMPLFHSQTKGDTN